MRKSLEKQAKRYTRNVDADDFFSDKSSDNYIDRLRWIKGNKRDQPSDHPTCDFGLSIRKTNIQYFLKVKVFD